MTSNQEILDNYLDNRKKGKSKNVNRCNLNAFLRNFQKPLYDVQKIDIIDFYDYLNNNGDYILETKKTIFSNTKQFLLNYLARLESEILNDKNLKIEEKLSGQMRINSMLNYVNNGQNFKWNQGNHKEYSNSNKDVVLTVDEVVNIVQYFKIKDNMNLKNNKYLMIRLLAETGMRKGELISIDLETQVNSHVETLEETLKNRYVRTTGKTSKKRGDKKYYLSEELSFDLLEHLKHRKTMEVKDVLKEKFKPFFISNQRKRYHANVLNAFIHKAVEFYEILDENDEIKKVGTHTFRKTINTLRAQKNCPEGLLERLLNHKLSVNQEHYNKTTDKELIVKFDKYNPYIYLF